MPDEVDESCWLVVREDEGAEFGVPEGAVEERLEVVVAVGEHPRVGGDSLLAAVTANEQRHVGAPLALEQQVESGGVFES